jgi:hypothetical protein
MNGPGRLMLARRNTSRHANSEMKNHISCQLLSIAIKLARMTVTEEPMRHRLEAERMESSEHWFETLSDQ